jgi:hypothetical protein
MGIASLPVQQPQQIPHDFVVPNKRTSGEEGTRVAFLQLCLIHVEEVLLQPIPIPDAEVGALAETRFRFRHILVSPVDVPVVR